MVLAAMTGRILAPFCILVPFWLIWAFAGFSGMLEVWPAILVAGVTFADSAAPGFEYARPMGGQRRGLGRFHDLPDRFSAGLAPQEGMEV